MGSRTDGRTRRDADRTRRVLLNAAFEEMWRSGYQAANLDAILSRARVTKGAMYHHFGGKRELGHAVIDEVLRAKLREVWLRGLDDTFDPIPALADIVRANAAAPPSLLQLGCPLNTLAQEMSPVDEGFRVRLRRLFDQWRATVAKALERGQRHGTVRPDVSPRDAAVFVVAAIEGAIGLAKNARDRSILKTCSAALVDYLESLRPGAVRDRTRHAARRKGKGDSHLFPHSGQR